MRGRRWLVTAVTSVAVLFATGCTGAGAPGHGRGPGGSATGLTGTNIPTTTSTGRPLEPVPSVRPKGMVAAPAGTGLSRYTAQRLRWGSCSDTADTVKQCATVLVPLDYSHPDGPAITLAVARRPSTGRSRGTLFINPGGPGGSGVDFVDYFAAHGLQKSYDIVGWDPRGVGRSTPVRCFDDARMEDFTATDYSPDTAAETRGLIRLDTAFGRTCLAKSGQLLEHVSTADTVRDLDLLRRLVGDRRLNYFGSSYGTSIGALYATRYPAKVGRMVLDGATDIGGATQVSQTYGFNRTLGHFAAWCAARGCRLGATKAAVLATITRLLQRLDQHTIPGGRRDLTQALATSGLVYALYSPASSWPVLLQGLEQAAYDDNGASLLSWADAYNQRTHSGHFGQFNASFPAIRCLDITDHGVAGALKDWRRVEQKAPTLGPFIGPDLGCPTWPVASTGDTEKPIHFSGPRTILILGTTGDPATPYEYARHMHKALSSSRLITLRGNGHLAYDQSACVQRKVLRYLEKDRLPRRDSTCTDG